MKLILILLSIVGATYAGVGVVTPEIEAKALALWAKYCEGASEGGNDEGAFIYCKKSPDKIEENLTHDLELTSNPSTSEQIVFVQPPSYHYKHDVVVSGGGASAPKTVIYVKAPKNTHEVNIEDKTSGGAAPQKPSLYFLKGNHGGGDAPTASRRRRHHTAGHEGQDTESFVTDLNDPSAAIATSEGAASPDLPEPLSKPKPVVYILKMRT